MHIVSVVVTFGCHAMQEAEAAGVKEISAGQRLLKAVQNLEAIMQRAEPDNLHMLRDRVAAAEQAGAGTQLLRSAKALERRLLLTEVRLTASAIARTHIPFMPACHVHGLMPCNCRIETAQFQEFRLASDAWSLLH